MEEGEADLMSEINAGESDVCNEDASSGEVWTTISEKMEGKLEDPADADGRFQLDDGDDEREDDLARHVDRLTDTDDDRNDGDSDSEDKSDDSEFNDGINEAIREFHRRQHEQIRQQLDRQQLREMNRSSSQGRLAMHPPNRYIKKCKSATFALDGMLYTIRK